MNVDILEKYNQTNQFGNYLDLKIKILKPGDVKYTVLVKKHHLATLKSAHGGFISAIFDQIVSTAALSKLILESKLVSSVEFKINFLKPVFLGDDLIGHGLVIQGGKKLYKVKGDIFNQNNNLVATEIATLNAYTFEKSDISS